MTLQELNQTIGIVATIIAIAGGSVGLYKYVSDKREIALREWQKVALHKIFMMEGNAQQNLRFSDILDKYHNKADIAEISVKKKDMREDALRRVLLELVSSGIILSEENDTYCLNLHKSSLMEITLQLNSAIYEFVGKSPFKYTVNEVANQIANQLMPKLQSIMPWFGSPFVGAQILMLLQLGALEFDDNHRIAFRGSKIS